MLGPMLLLLSTLVAAAGQREPPEAEKNRHIGSPSEVADVVLNAGRDALLGGRHCCGDSTPEML